MPQPAPLSDSNTNTPKSLAIFGLLVAISCISHFSVHLRAAAMSLEWLLAASCVLASFAVLHRPNVQRILLLAGIQIAHFLADAPFNPDHWVLLCLVHAVLLCAALRQWLRHRQIDPQQLMAQFSPGAKLIFLICYSFAAISKFNSDFLLSDLSAAQALQQLQVGGFPALKYVVWPPAAPWLALICETALPICLCVRPLRKYGITIALLFHAALILSPAVKVYDFTFAVYTMLYLFTSADFDAKLFAHIQQFKVPAMTGRIWNSLLVAGAATILATSFDTPLMSVSTNYVVRRWQVAMVVTLIVIAAYLLTMFANSVRSDANSKATSELNIWPKWGLPYVFVALALLNGLCPYLGLKTQGSFTMFSNLQTEAGQWNHFFMPKAMRVFDDYQDQLVAVVSSSDKHIKTTYIDRNLLATEFEIRRKIMEHPDITLTVRENGQEIDISAESDSRLAQPLDWWQKKLLIFRPVSPDGKPFTSN